MKIDTLFDRLCDICELYDEAFDAANTQAEQDAALRPAIQKFWAKYGKHVTPAFLDALEDENYHTARRLIIAIFKEKYH